MKFDHKKAIFFDLDGTLIDSVPDLALAINKMLITLKKEPLKEETIRYFVGNGAPTLVKRALLRKRDIERSVIEEALFEKALQLFLKAYEDMICKSTMLYPSVKKTLSYLKNKGYRLTIITNKPIQFVPPILHKFDLDTLFEIYLGGDSLALKKPNPFPLLHLCKKMNLQVEEVFMIGDSKNDIQAANACSMESIGVTYGYNYGEHIGSYNPTLIIDNFEELKNIL